LLPAAFEESRPHRDRTNFVKGKQTGLIGEREGGPAPSKGSGAGIIQVGGSGVR